MLELNDLLAKAGLDPARTLVMRHRPQEPELRRVFAWIATERRDLFIAYQSSHFPRAEAAVRRATHIAAMIGLTPGEAEFVCLLRNHGHRIVDRDEFWRMPVIRELHGLGMAGWSEGHAGTAAWFDLEEDPALHALELRLRVQWTGLERSWYRWAARNTFPIKAIRPERQIDLEMPPWDELVLSWTELAALPPPWAVRLAEWRGIYLITDTADGRQYVGSAYGTENLLGRWRTYAATGHGGNRDLRGRDPASFRFSILQRVSPDMDGEDVIALEAGWKTRLLTRELGLNAN